MVFMKWLVIVIVVLVVIVFVIKICTKNKDSDDGDEFENRMSTVGKLWDRCCAKVKRRHGI